MNQLLHYVVLDSRGRVLWYGPASSASAAVRAAKEEPIVIDRPHLPNKAVGEVHVLSVLGGPKIGPKAIRSAMEHGTFVGTYAV